MCCDRVECGIGERDVDVVRDDDAWPMAKQCESSGRRGCSLQECCWERGARCSAEVQTGEAEPCVACDCRDRFGIEGECCVVSVDELLELAAALGWVATGLDRSEFEVNSEVDGVDFWCAEGEAVDVDDVYAAFGQQDVLVVEVGVHDTVAADVEGRERVCSLT